MEPTYLVRGSDGKEYGPAALSDLLSWIKEGRVPARQEVRRSDMNHWAAAEEYLELRPAFSNPSPSTDSSLSSGNAATAVATAPAAFGTTVSAAGTDPATVAQMKSGGSWFYWVAGLSLVNTISALSGSDWRFILGLGITQIFDGFGSELGSSGKLIATVLDLLAAGVFIGFGLFANKGHAWAFIIGMVLFALDGLIFLMVKDWIGVGFHAFVLYCLFRGFSACRQLSHSR